MPTYDVPSFQDFVDGESSTVRGKLNSNFDNAEVQIQGVEDRLEESLTALHIDGVIWKRPGDVVDLLVSAGAGLSVNISAGEALIGYRIQDTGHSNDAGNGITNGAVNYCFLKQNGTLWFNITGTPPTDQRNILLATVTTAGGVVTAVNNYANGVVRGVGQPSLRSFTCTATEAVRDAVYVSAANTVAQAESDSASPAKARVVGVILAKETATSCVVATDGAIVGGFTGLTSGSAYYLHTVAGQVSTTKPTAPDPIVPVGIAVSTTALLVKIFIDEAVITGTGGGDLPSLSDVDDALAYTAGFVLRADGAQYTGQALAHADLSDDNEIVHTSGNQTVGGLKTFSTLPQSSVVPATGADLVNKTYADAFAQGLTPKEACRVATTAAGTLASDFENGDTIDGIVLATGDRILIKNQADATTNGIYTVNASGAPTRATDYDASAEVQEGTFCYIAAGTANGGKEFVQITVDPVLDTNNLVFVWLSNPNLYTASSGVKLVAQDFQIDLSDTNPSLEVADGGLRAKVDDVTIQRDATGLEVKAVSGALLTSLASTPGGAGVVPTANLGSGVADATKFLRGDQSWQVPLGIGAGITALAYTKALETDITQTTVVNSAAETTLYTYTVPGGTLGTDKALRVAILGQYKNASGSNKTLTVRMKYGGTTLTAKTSGNLGTNVSAGNFCFAFLLGASGATSEQQGWMSCSCESGADVSLEWTDRGRASIDSTVDQALLITVQHSAANANLSITTTLQHIELLNAEETVGSPIDASYVVMSTDANLTAERTLQGTANQVVITDNGPNAAVVLSTPQDIHDAASPTFGGMTLGAMDGALVATAGVVDTWDWEALLQQSGDNLIIEGSFEGPHSIGESGHFIWAAQQSGNGVAPVRDNTDSRHGRYCTKFVVAISAGSDYSQLYYLPSVSTAPYLAVSGDDDYAWGWEFWAKSVGATETLQFMLECYDKDAALLATRIPVNNGVIPAAWTKYSGLFRGEGAGSTQFPAGTVFLRPIFRLTESGGAGTLYLDDVRIYRLPLAEVTARKNSAGSVYQRKRVNFIEGTNVTLTLADDATDEEIDLTIAATSLPYIRNEIIVVVAGALTASTTVPKVGYMKAPAALTIEEVVCEVDTAPTGAALIVDIHKIPVADIETDFTGTTIYTTQGNRPTLAIGDRHVVATAPDVTAIAQGDVLRVYVDQIGSTIAGSDLTVCVRVKQQAAWS